MSRIKLFCLNNIDVLAAIVISVFSYIILFGVHSLDPKNIDIVMSGGDLFQNYLGGVVYRSEPLSWDLFKINSIGFPLGVSVLAVDGNPLMSLIMKLIKLPAYDQFFGIWSLICFILSGIASVFIFRHAFKNKFLIVVASIFFVLSPIVIFRFWSHVNLMAHWLILFSLAVYLANQSGVKTWAAYVSLLALSFLIHPYFAPMIFLLAMIHLLKKIFLDKKLTIYQGIAILLPFVFVIGVSLLLVFPGGSGGRGGWGVFSMNLNAPVNSMGTSLFLKPFSWEWGQYEGYNYLGLGVIVLLLISARKMIQEVNRENILKNGPILLYCLFLTGGALSGKIYLNNFLLLDYSNPLINYFGGFLRSSGRLFWPVWYLLVYYVIKTGKRACGKNFWFILPILLVVQLIDLKPLFVHKMNTIALQKTEKYTPLSSDWGNIFETHPHVFLINSPDHYDKFWFAIPKYAITLNFGYLTGVKKEIWKEMEKVQIFISEGYLPFKPNTLFIINDRLYEELKNNKSTPQQKRLFESIKTQDGIHYLPFDPKFKHSREVISEEMLHLNH